MTRNLVNILVFTAIASVLVVTVLGILLVLELTSTPNAKDTLTKSLLIVSIIAISSIVTLIIIKFGSKG